MEYVKGGQGAFLTDTMILDAVVRNLQIMAESNQASGFSGTNT
jgi:uncharacterized protein with HEPN domain